MKKRSSKKKASTLKTKILSSSKKNKMSVRKKIKKTVGKKSEHSTQGKHAPKKRVLKPVLKPVKLKFPHKRSGEIKPSLAKYKDNPIITPSKDRHWESVQTFNPAALFDDGMVHILYRALGNDGISVIGYAQSKDGIKIDSRSEKPVYACPLGRQKFSGPSYDPGNYTSGGGYGGCEDPRITKIDDKVYMTYVSYDAWSAPRIALTSINIKDFLKQNWKWTKARIISPPGIVDKSGCLFPEKIKGKYVMLHRVFPDILVDFIDDLEFSDGNYLKGQHRIKVRNRRFWDSRKIGAGAPPIKTKYGWLLIYYGVDDKNASQYKIGAMLLDLDDPLKVLYRTDEPILEPDEWYENEGHKAGVAYPCGAVVVDEHLLIYYGGADTVVCVAGAVLDDFLKDLMGGKKPSLKRANVSLKDHVARKTIR